MHPVLVLCALVLLAVTPAAAAEPDRQTISAHMAAALPAHLSLSDGWRSRTFPDAGGHNGRISIEGTLVLTQPLFDVASADSSFGLQNRQVQSGLHRLVADASARGVPPGQVLRIAEQRRRLSWGTRVLEQTLPRGTELPFRAEIRYLETVSGFDLSGRPQYTMPEGLLPSGIQNALLRDSIEYMRTVDIIVGAWEQEQQVLRDNAAAMEAFLAQTGLTASFPLQRNASPAPVLIVPPIVPTWNEDSYRAFNGAEIRRLSFAYLAASEIVTPVSIGQTSFSPGQSIDIMVKGSVIGDDEMLTNARLTIELPSSNPPGLTGEMRWTGERFAVTPSVPDSGWQFAVRNPETPEPAPDRAASSSEAPADEPQAGSATLAEFDGLWRSADGKLTVEITDGVGTVVSGGSGQRPDGIDIVRFDGFDGTRATGQMRFGGGNFRSVSAQNLGGRLNFQGGGFRWYWERTSD